MKWGPNGDLRQQKWGPKKRIFDKLTETSQLYRTPPITQLSIHPSKPIFIANVKVCEDWDIPYVSLDEMETEDIMSVIGDMEPKPRVILSTISRISQEDVQKQLRRLPVRTICLDEVQVHCGEY